VYALRLIELLALLILPLLLLVALVGAWMVRAAPLDPPWARGLFRLDGLAACFSALTIAVALATHRSSALSHQSPVPSSQLAACILLCAAYLSTHVAVLSVGLLGTALLLGLRRWESWAASGLASAGLVLIALRADAWRYPTPDIGLGLNSLSFGLILCAALLAAGAPALVSGRASRPVLLLAVGLIYTLYRLFSFGPWNLGWQLAALLLGAAVAFGAAWHVAFHASGRMPDRLATLHFGLAIIGGGLASGAGLALGVYALLALTLQQAMLLGASAMQHRSATIRLFWLVSGAVPFTVPFVAGWIGIAGALAGGITVLAVVIWASLLLAAVGLARMAEPKHNGIAAGEQPDEAITDDRRLTTDHRTSTAVHRPSSVVHRPSSVQLWLASLFSLALGIATPAVFALLIQPMVAQLQGGLTPFGEVTLWPWAGLLALNAARQPVATLPSLALAALMLILAALAWVVSQVVAMRRTEEPGES
jgi:hypothetical protein